MKEAEFYTTIQQTSTAEFKDRGSRFIGYAFPVENTEEFKKYLQQVKKEHPKASHHCFAYRIGFDGNIFRSSDDGEPSGTAGKPILGQIDSKGITNTLIIVVRYFGGTMLGVPGLIHAYKTTAALALQVVAVIQKPIEILYELQFDYTRMNEIMLLIKQLNCSVILQEMQLFCKMKIGVPKNRLPDFEFKIKDIPGTEVKKV